MRLLLIIFSIFFFQAQAQPLKIASLPYPPFTYLEDNKPKGFAVDIVSEIMSRLDVEHEILIMPWARAMRGMQTGEVDALFPMFKTAERQQFSRYPDLPVVYESMAMFVPGDSTISSNSDINALSGFTFCLVRGYSAGKQVDAAIADKVLTKIDLANSSTLNLKKFLRQRCNILIDNDAVVYSLLPKVGGSASDIKILRHLIQEPSYLGFSKLGQGSELSPKVTETIQTMLKDGTLHGIVERYLGKGVRNWPQ
ncbi:transporter substrate-binding domain-containing protein [Vibrio sp. S4M6]|uniref:substrate-binding periplasmic protein n=1 Tax=Vibrio sinus TaxID=2946865 RepID=UPI00202A77A3|nr:transporter substrate-binding domain-containing protein [Vibrio sinus]MCL9783596.1 transporter substrate-binding domain-containing protein [Vibrio sinus]